MGRTVAVQALMLKRLRPRRQSRIRQKEQVVRRMRRRAIRRNEKLIAVMKAIEEPKELSRRNRRMLPTAIEKRKQRTTKEKENEKIAATTVMIAKMQRGIERKRARKTQRKDKRRRKT